MSIKLWEMNWNATNHDSRYSQCVLYVCSCCMCVPSYLCLICVACVCDCFPLHACVSPLTPWPFSNMAASPRLSRSRSIGTSPVHQQGNAPQNPLFSWHASWLYSQNVVLVEITRRKNANAIRTAILQQLRDRQPLYNAYTLCLDKHDTTGSERHTHTGLHTV